LEVNERFVALIRERGLAHTLTIWPMNKSLAPLRESGHFHFTREVLLHHVEYGDAARYLAMMQSSAFSHQFQFTDQETGSDRLRLAAFHYIGSEPIPWYWSYRVRIGIK
jgi:hypothetical protein